jgi:hypothetical protein
MNSEFQVFVGIWAVLFFINVIVSFFVANAAAKKGRSWAAFFWLSFLFSWVIMAIAVAVMAPNTPVNKDSTRLCPKCAEPISVKALLCKHCKSEITPLNESKQNASPAKAGERVSGIPESANLGIRYLSFSLMGIGLLWIITYYATSGQLPIESLGNWNIMLGLFFSMLGFVASLAGRTRT